MGMTLAEAVETVCRDLQLQVGDRDLTRAEIVRRVVKAYQRAPSSVLPSDHCYNRTNRGIRSEHVPFLLHVGGERSGRYRYVGRGYQHQGVIDHYPIEGGHRQVTSRDDC